MMISLLLDDEVEPEEAALLEEVTLLDEAAAAEEEGLLEVVPVLVLPALEAALPADEEFTDDVPETPDDAGWESKLVEEVPFSVPASLSSTRLSVTSCEEEAPDDSERLSFRPEHPTAMKLTATTKHRAVTNHFKFFISCTSKRING